MVLSNWNTLDSDLCDWNGVSCTATRDHVIKLILHGNSLVGVIPKELGMLKSLKVLDLGINHLIGPIPPEIGNLTQVMKMYASGVNLTGFCRLSQLKVADFSYNFFVGSIPKCLASLFNPRYLRMILIFF
ncbi:hypothetical protein GLYMA_12G167901v4 [Glycine max]|nr:hypothetical protein GLYMA_12G167901v4 [Glycine max]KAH1143529.1 hypothetical protein GYH30_033998 [Glycine max]